MENIEIFIENEDQTPEESEKVIIQLIDDISKNIEETNGEVKPTENQIEEENVGKNDDDRVVPSTAPNSNEDQENAIDVNKTIPASVSPGRANVPFKEVNENEKEACSAIVNGTENINNKKREFDNEDEQVQEKNCDNDERTSDQIKKIKITESADIPTVEV
jgi:hypothetical protein